jgi:membrane protease subunit HflK
MEQQAPRTINVHDFEPPKGMGRLIGIGLIILVVLMIVMSSFYQVQPEEVGVVLRFGRYNREATPGLHMKWPAPIERVLPVPIQRQLKQEFGFQTAETGVRTTYHRGDFKDESLMLTGDLNVAVVEWTTQYRVTDPKKYLFMVRNVDETFRYMNEAVMRAVIGDRSVNEVLTVGRQEIADEVEERLQEMCVLYENGIKVEQVVLKDVNPPDPVKPSFNEVNQAEQEKERAINDARSEYNRIIPKARGEAEQMIQQAEGYKVERINKARGDVVLFEELLAAYKRAPEVTRRRIYLETMEAIYPKVQRKVLFDEEMTGVLPLLSLEKAGGAQ